MDVPVAWGSQRAAVLDIGALRFMELRFPSALVLPPHAHDRPTLAVVMNGSFQTRLAADVELCERSSLRIEPAGSQHTNHFGPLGAHIVVVQPDPTSALLGPAAAAFQRAEHRRDEQLPLFEACDRALVRTIDALRPTHVIGVGAFAKDRAERALDGQSYRIGTILHPSPASPLANRGWGDSVRKKLADLGIKLP